MKTPLRILLTLLPFWLFLSLYKFGAVIHYEVTAPLGEYVLPLWIVGVVMAIGSFIQLLMDVPAGHLLDRYGYRRLLMVTTAVFFFAGLILLLPFSLPVYLASFAIATIGWIFYGPGINAYTLSHATREYAGLYMSYRDIFASVGVVLASACLGFVLQLGPHAIGLIVCVAMCAAFISMLLAPKDKEKAHAERKIDFQNYYIRRRYLRHLLSTVRKLDPAGSTLMLLSFASCVFYGIIWFVVPVVIAHQADGTLLSLGLGIFDFSVVVMGYFIGVLADKGHHRRQVFFGLLLFSIAGTLLGLNFGWLFLIFGFLATTGEETATVSLWSWLHLLDHNHSEDGLISGVVNLFEDLGWCIGPLVAGILYELIGPSWTIAVGASLLFVTWLIYQFTLQKYGMPQGVRPAHTPRRLRHKH